MLKVCCQNQLKWRYALADSWFSSSENMKYITNKDDSTGTLYLISNDLSATAAPLETIYQKRWKVEVFHKSIIRFKTREFFY